MNELAQAIQQLAGTFNRDWAEILLCTVTAVDEDNFTCTCDSLTGEAVTEGITVKFNAESNDGFSVVPAVDSTVMVANSTRNGYYIFMTSDIQAVVCVIDGQNSFRFDSSGFKWNDGLFGGMAKTPVLTSKLNALETVANQLIATAATIQAFASGSPTTPVTNGTLGTMFAAIGLVPLVPTTQIEIEDNKIKH